MNYSDKNKSKNMLGNEINLSVTCRWTELSPEMQLQIVRFINHAAAWPGANSDIRKDLDELCSRTYFKETEVVTE